MDDQVRSANLLMAAAHELELEFLDSRVGIVVSAFLAAADRIAELEAKVERLGSEVMALETCLEEKRDVIEALGEHSADSDLWATMKRQRDGAEAEADRLRGLLSEWVGTRTSSAGLAMDTVSALERRGGG